MHVAVTFSLHWSVMQKICTFCSFCVGFIFCVFHACVYFTHLCISSIYVFHAFVYLYECVDTPIVSDYANVLFTTSPTKHKYFCNKSTSGCYPDGAD